MGPACRRGWRTLWPLIVWAVRTLAWLARILGYLLMFIGIGVGAFLGYLVDARLINAREALYEDGSVGYWLNTRDEWPSRAMWRRLGVALVVGLVAWLRGPSLVRELPAAWTVGPASGLLFVAAVCGAYRWDQSREAWLAAHLEEAAPVVEMEVERPAPPWPRLLSAHQFNVRRGADTDRRAPHGTTSRSALDRHILCAGTTGSGKTGK